MSRAVGRSDLKQYDPVVFATCDNRLSPTLHKNLSFALFTHQMMTNHVKTQQTSQNSTEWMLGEAEEESDFYFFPRDVSSSSLQTTSFTFRPSGI